MTLDSAFSSLETPCLLLDKHRVQRNIQRMESKTQQAGVTLRPHLKTAKSSDIANLFNQGNPCPITVSTLKEAEYFAEAGYRDILYAVSIAPNKLHRAFKLCQTGVNLHLLLDQPQSAQALLDFAQTNRWQPSVFIEIDCDGHRAGLTPEDPKLIECATLLSQGAQAQLGKSCFAGLMTHGGGSYDCHNKAQAKAHAEQERQACLKAAALLLQHNIVCPHISTGSTPTVVAGTDFSGINEVRPGVFVFFDLFQWGMGLCEFDDLALSVLCTVIGHKADQNRLFIDAGALALSKDRSTQEQRQDYGYGLVCHIDGSQAPLALRRVNQEHGVVSLDATAALADYPIGSQLRIYPNHACMTAAAYETYQVFDSQNPNADVLQWPRCNRW